MEPESLAWTVRLSEKTPEKVITIWIVAVLCGLGGVFLLHSIAFGLIGFIAITASTAEYWMGATYRVDAKGAQCRVGFSTTAIEWTNVKRVVVDNNTLKLSPLEKESRSDPFRGVTLRVNESNREAVLSLLRIYCGQDVRFLGN